MLTKCPHWRTAGDRQGSARRPRETCSAESQAQAPTGSRGKVELAVELVMAEIDLEFWQVCLLEQLLYQCLNIVGCC